MIMMKSNFDSIINRTNTNSLKYDFTSERERPDDILPLWVADMDFIVAPEIQQRLYDVVNHGIYGYSDSKDGYYQAIYSWFRSKFNYEIKKEWIVKTPGVVFALAQAVRAFTKLGDGVIIQTPVYYPFKEVIIDNGRRVITNSLVLKNAHYEIDFDDFEEKIKKEKVKLFILCSPHNPVGRVWKKDELLKLGQICLKNDVKIISDEIHSDFIYPGHQHHVFASLKTELQNITITCTAPTKTFNLAGLQISNIFIADEKLRLQFKKAIASTGYSQCNLFGLAACQTAYESCSSWLEDLKQYLFENTRFVDEYLKEHIPLIKLIIPEGTYLLWLDFRRLQISDKELNDLLIEHARLWLDSGTMFGKEGKGFQRINIACPRAYLRQALNQLKNALEEIEY